MKLSITAPVAALFAAAVSAHGGVLSYDIGGTTYKGFVPYNSAAGQSTLQREWDSYNPIQDPTLASMACNSAGTPGALTATVAAGSTIVAYWNNPWPHTIGPMVVWMANCGGDCKTFEPTGNVWFKINQAGLISGTLSTGLWGSGQMVAQNSSWTVTIPKSLAPGNYLIRHETIAIHTANAPQWYPECAQLVLTGSGTGVPGASYLAAIPGVYQMRDPEVDIDVYSAANQGVTNYTIPGPAVWTG
ncbi:glycoside hydrolase [Mollisia scopiformis]|uniref:AA9 family lytic polysaccharide monooxygenase n=1 Tax=Mollisia scopiformis TaxID=149040 RepID=A0A194XMA2_MOLSC|nr:glycoside hydrolase [Mollisia scopiformis]KUJ21308.1 glycoside hydrolase [Mollisia scopiformis]